LQLIKGEKVKKVILMAFLLPIILGCIDKKVDSSTVDSFKSSLKAIEDSLQDDEKKKKFKKAMRALRFSAIDNKLKVATNHEKLQQKIKDKLNGKTANEIIVEGNSIISEQKKKSKRTFKEIEEIKIKISELEQKRSEAENTKVNVVRSLFYFQENSIFNAPVVELTVKNQTQHALSSISFHGVLKSPGRTIPWVKDSFSYKISGGLEPGEQATWKLAPNRFGKWGKVPKDRKDMVLTVAVTSIYGADELPIYISEFSEWDKKKLNELKTQLIELETTIQLCNQFMNALNKPKNTNMELNKSVTASTTENIATRTQDITIKDSKTTNPSLPLSDKDAQKLILAFIKDKNLRFPVMAKDGNKNNIAIDRNNNKYVKLDNLTNEQRLNNVIKKGSVDYAILIMDFNNDGFVDIFFQLKSGKEFVLYWLNKATGIIKPFKYARYKTDETKIYKGSQPFPMHVEGHDKNILRCLETYYSTACFGWVEGKILRLNTSLLEVEGEVNFQCDDEWSYKLEKLTEKWAYIKRTFQGETSYAILPKEHYEMTGFVWGTNVNVRTGGGKDYKKEKVLFQLQNGDVFKILDEKDGWYKIECRLETGWIIDDYVKHTPPPKKKDKDKKTTEQKQSQILRDQLNALNLTDLDELWSMPSSFLDQKISCFVKIHEIHEENNFYNILVGDGLKLFDMKNPMAFAIRVDKQDKQFVKMLVKLKGEEVILTGHVRKGNDLLNLYYLAVDKVEYHK
jgi:uncharacterized protein YgiM (DUF1202 family)